VSPIPMRRVLTMAIVIACSVLLSPHIGAMPSGDKLIVLTRDSVRPGDTVTVAWGSSEAGGPVPNYRAILKDPSGVRRSSSPSFFLSDSSLRVAIVPISSTCPTGVATVLLEGKGGALLAEEPLEVATRVFVEEDIPLDEENTALRTLDSPRKTAESALLWELITTFDQGAQLATGAFTLPVDSKRRTSFFGDRRTYLYADGSTDFTLHNGIDFGVPRGTPVRACAAGKVVFAGDREVTGGSIIIEHLPLVFSLYYHLDSVGLTEGASVTQGQIIGASGATGLATGPHLHWELRVCGVAVDPDAMRLAYPLDKALILGKIASKYGR